jgi:penicillin-binding protein 1A
MANSPNQATSSDATPGALITRFRIIAVLLLSVTAGGLTGILASYELNFSRAANEVAALATYQPSVVTRIYADDGKTVIGEFALERRIPLTYEEIPENVKHAILAVEDSRFYKHIGIDPIRIIGAVFKNLRTGRREGGSTLTQQLAKNLFLSREQTIKRKMNEWVVALQIERFYTKNQIMEMYANHIYLGAGAYGIEAGAETYFGKQAKELTIEEAALLAGMPKAPGMYSPTVDMQAARERRNIVLDLMAENGYISEEDAELGKTKPINLADSAYQPPKSSPFAYPVEEIRRVLEEKYTTRVAQGGLQVYSTINAEAQRKAHEAVRTGLRWYDRTHSGWRSQYSNIGSGNRAPTTAQLAGYKHPDWFDNSYEPEGYVMGLITKISPSRNEATARFGSYTSTITAEDMGWSGRSPRTEFKIGDLAQFQVKEVDKRSKKLKVELSQIPAIQGALVTINAKNGEIVTMVGGYDFYTNKFNNATQAYRQTGSCFKPFIYTAAVEWGMTPETVISGAPIVRGDWMPHNYDGSTDNSDMPMKVALAKSMNIPAVHTLDMVGIQTAAQMVRRFGITVPMAPYLPSALGATEVPLIQMVSAYSAFPNKGVRVEPHLIRKVIGRDGITLEEHETKNYKVTSEYVALTMTSMLKAVVDNGTAVAAKSLGVPQAGKTGTVNDQTDVWFIGFTPTYVTGVWMGYPGRKKSLGKDMTGSRGALPIYIDFMKEFLKDKKKEEFEKAPAMPEDIKELAAQRNRELARMRREAAESAVDEFGEREPLMELPKLDLDSLPPLLNERPDSQSTPSNKKGGLTPPTDSNPRKNEISIPNRGIMDSDNPRGRSTPDRKRGKKGTEDSD